MISGAAISTARAEECWRLFPFPDVVRVAETTYVDDKVAGTHTLVVGKWDAGNFYSLPVVGSLDINIPLTSPSTQRFGVHGTNHTTAFGNHSDCTLDAQLDGPWKLSCDGNVDGIFNNSGTPFAHVSCAAAPLAATTNAKAAGY
jgi:hypothetical protein